MKNLAKWFGIVALVAAIAITAASCDNGSKEATYTVWAATLPYSDWSAMFG